MALALAQLSDGLPLLGGGVDAGGVVRAACGWKRGGAARVKGRVKRARWVRRGSKGRSNAVKQAEFVADGFV